MDKDTFEAANPVVDEIAAAVTELLESPATERLRNLFVQLAKALGSRYAASLAVNVEVFDREKERCVPLLQTGMSGFDGDRVYQVWGDSSPQRYIVNGDMQVVPHDRCPNCWELWDFKFKHQSCRHCGVTLGTDVKLLLDTDVCPWCEDGKVSMSQPTCDKCGHTVDPETVVWG